MSDPTQWHLTSQGLPHDREIVCARAKYGTTVRRMRFLATPVPRWESEDGRTVYSAQYVHDWTPDRRPVEAPLR